MKKKWHLTNDYSIIYSADSPGPEGEYNIENSISDRERLVVALNSLEDRNKVLREALEEHRWTDYESWGDEGNGQRCVHCHTFRIEPEEHHEGCPFEVEEEGND